MFGFSTGALAKGDFRSAITMLDAHHLEAIELSALRLSELDVLLNALPSLALSAYKHVTLHAPSRFDGADEAALASKLLRALPFVGGVVLHAEAIIEPRHWAPFGDRLLVENADGRKATGRTLEELQSVMAPLPQARICFDVAHAYQVDPTLIEARRMIRVFGSRIAQLHVSQLDHACAHHGLTHGIVQQFQTLMPPLSDVPAILESCVPAAEIGRQLDLARMCFAPQQTAAVGWAHAAE